MSIIQNAEEEMERGLKNLKVSCLELPPAAALRCVEVGKIVTVPQHQMTSRHKISVLQLSPGGRARNWQTIQGRWKRKGKHTETHIHIHTYSHTHVDNYGLPPKCLFCLFVDAVCLFLGTV